MKKVPNFERVPGHQFKAGEKIYATDNDFDIWEAEIVNVTEDGYKIFYPEWPDEENTFFPDDSRIFVRTPHNDKIFKAQEAIRREKDKEDAGFATSDSESEEFSDEETKKKKKKAKPKKEKPKKEKKEKPKKEKKEKPKKEAKPKHKLTEKDLQKIKKQAVKMALQKKLSNADQYIAFFDNTFRKKYGDIMDKISGDSLDLFQKYLHNDENDEDNMEEIEFGSDLDEQNSNSEEEEIKFDIPETILLPSKSQKIQPVYGFTVTNTALSFNKENDPFPILFDKDGYCNCFVYKTPATQYLIINGMRFELQEKENDERSRYFFFEEEKVSSPESEIPPVSSSFMRPVLEQKDVMKIIPPAEAYRYLDSQTKKKNKVKLISSIPPEESISEPSTHKSQKKQRKDRTDKEMSNRNLDDHYIEESD